MSNERNENAAVGGYVASALRTVTRDPGVHA